MRLSFRPLLFLCMTFGLEAVAQDMEPRAFSNAPIGTNFLGSGFAYSSGGLSVDPTLPVTDVKAYLRTYSAAYSRFYSLGGRTASWALLLPYVYGSVSGDIGEERRKIYRSGMADTRIRLSTNIIGGPALTPEEFTKRTPSTSLGASILIVAPTGQYTSDRLINIGSNRWAFKPELGISQPIGNWFVEGSTGVSFFTNNDDFFGGRERKQDPIPSVQGHAGYNFSPGLWLAGNATYWSGGETEIDGLSKHDTQSNSRLGATLSVPLSKSFSLKLAWSTGYTTRIGSDFDSYVAAVQYRWFDGELAGCRKTS